MLLFLETHISWRHASESGNGMTLDNCGDRRSEVIHFGLPFCFSLKLSMVNSGQAKRVLYFSSYSVIRESLGATLIHKAP